MKAKYADSENETKHLTRPDWKAQLIKSYFAQNGFSKKSRKEAKSLLLGMGWTLRSQRLPPNGSDRKQVKIDVLRPDGEVILSFETEDAQDDCQNA
jgi:hypothetical protein